MDPPPDLKTHKAISYLQDISEAEEAEQRKQEAGKQRWKRAMASPAGAAVIVGLLVVLVLVAVRPPLVTRRPPGNPLAEPQLNLLAVLGVAAASSLAVVALPRFF